LTVRAQIQKDKIVRFGYIYYFSSLAGISSICKMFKIFGGIERHFRAKKRAAGMPPVVWAMLSVAPELVKEGGESAGFHSEVGGTQGLPPTPIFFCIALHPHLRAAEKRLKEHAVVLEVIPTEEQKNERARNQKEKRDKRNMTKEEEHEIKEKYRPRSDEDA
jgi:hypothetical protein